MYPSNSNGNNTYPLDQATPYWPSLYDINPYSKPPEEDPFPSFFHFPPPYIPYEDDVILLQHLHDILLQQQQQQQPLTAEGTTPEAVGNMEKSNNNELYGRKDQISRKRSSKKDRHSKITTAQGQRDRRMRLSLDVARKFFRLQDTLGFDKASKTVEWLLIKSKSAIKELTSGLPHMKQRCSTVAANSTTASSTSECEVVSGIDESAVDGNRPAVRKPSESSAKQKKSTRALRKSAFHPLARESREKARARARERTIEKRRLDESKLPLEAMNHDMNRLGFWSPFENGGGSGTQNHNINPHLECLADVEELSSSVIFNYDLQNSGITQEQYQLTDFEVYGKPWEAYNNINLC